MINNINSVRDVEIFASQLVNDENLSFHPDDNFSDYINFETNKFIYSDEKAVLLNKMMEQCFEVCLKQNVDIYELMGKPLFERFGIGLNT